MIEMANDLLNGMLATCLHRQNPHDESNMCIQGAGWLRLHLIICPSSKFHRHLTFSSNTTYSHQFATMVKPILFFAFATAALSSAQMASIPQRLRTSRKMGSVTLPASKADRNLLGSVEPDLRGKETFGEDIAEVSLSMSMSMVAEIDSTAPTAVPSTLMPTPAPTAAVEEDEGRWICSFCPVYVCRSCASD